MNLSVRAIRLLEASHKPSQLELLEAFPLGLKALWPTFFMVFSQNKWFWVVCWPPSICRASMLTILFLC